MTVNGDAPRSGAEPVEQPRSLSAGVRQRIPSLCDRTRLDKRSQPLDDADSRASHDLDRFFSASSFLAASGSVHQLTTSDSATSNAPRPLTKRSTGVFSMTAVRFWPGRVTRFASRHWPRNGGSAPYQPCGPVPTYVSFADLDLPAAWVLKPNNRTGLVFFGQSRCTDVEPICQLTETWKSDNRVIAKGEWAYTRAAPGFLVEERIGPVPGSPTDFKVFVFDDAPYMVQVDLDRFGHHQSRFYRPELATHASSGPGPRIGRDRQASLPR